MVRPCKTGTALEARRQKLHCTADLRAPETPLLHSARARSGRQRRLPERSKPLSIDRVNFQKFCEQTGTDRRYTFLVDCRAVFKWLLAENLIANFACPARRAPPASHATIHGTECGAVRQEGGGDTWSSV